MKRMAMASAGLSMLIGCTNAVEAPASQPVDPAVQTDQGAPPVVNVRPLAASDPPPVTEGPSVAVVAHSDERLLASRVGWASERVCDAGARTLAGCCELGGGSNCATATDNARCCGDKSCAEGKIIACLANYVPSPVDNCLGALSACNRM